jgi:hypothetical protein
MCGTDIAEVVVDAMQGGACSKCGLFFRFEEGSTTFRFQPHAFDAKQCLARYNEKHLTDIQDPNMVGWRVLSPDMRRTGLIVFDAAGRRVELAHEFRVHAARQTRKYSAHVKLVTSCHVAEEHARAIILESAYRRDKNKLKVSDMAEYLTYLERGRFARYGPVKARALAESCVPHLWGKMAHKLSDKMVVISKFFRDVPRSVAVSADIYLRFLDYFRTKSLIYFKTLKSNHPLKDADPSDMVDDAPVISRSGVRVCTDRENQPKLDICSCPEVSPEEKASTKTRRKLQAKKNPKYIPPLGYETCMVCQGSGKVEDASRPPMLVSCILVDPLHPRAEELQAKVDAFEDLLHSRACLPLVLAATSSRVDLAGFQGEFDTPTGLYVSFTPHLNELLRLVPHHPKRSCTQNQKVNRKAGPYQACARINDNSIAQAIETFVQQDTQVPEWAELVIESVSEFGTKGWYTARTAKSSLGAEYCVNVKRSHSSNTVYFILSPPNRMSNGKMYACCWSPKCQGTWQNAASLSGHQNWSIPPLVAEKIWPQTIPRKPMTVDEAVEMIDTDALALSRNRHNHTKTGSSSSTSSKSSSKSSKSPSSKSLKPTSSKSLKPTSSKSLKLTSSKSLKPTSSKSLKLTSSKSLKPTSSKSPSFESIDLSTVDDVTSTAMDDTTTSTTSTSSTTSTTSTSLTIDQDDSYQSFFGDVSQSSGGGASRDSFQSSPRKVFRASKPSTRERVMTKPSIEELLTLNKDDARRTMRAFQIVNGDHGEGSILSDLYSLVGLKNS